MNTDVRPFMHEFLRWIWILFFLFFFQYLMFVKTFTRVFKAFFIISQQSSLWRWRVCDKNSESTKKNEKKIGEICVYNNFAYFFCFHEKNENNTSHSIKMSFSFHLSSQIWNRTVNRSFRVRSQTQTHISQFFLIPFISLVP